MRTLLAIAVVFVLAGCASEAPPLPDIDATVEARLELAKASLVAPTAVPLPTYTPMPAPSPEVVVKEVVVEKEVPVEVMVEKVVEVIKEVQGPERVVTKEVPVEVQVIKELIKEVVVEKIVEVPVVVEKEVIVEKIVEKEVIVEKIAEVVVTATPTATPIPATEAVIVGWKTVEDVVSALEKHTLSERKDKAFDLVFAADGAGFEVNPGSYYLEFYVYEYESNIALGIEVLENLWRSLTDLTEAQVEQLIAGLVVENNILLLTAQFDETLLELLLADLRD